MTREETQRDSVPVACNLKAFDAAQAERYGALVEQLRAGVESVTEEENGFRFTLLSDPALCLAVMEFATLERRCCPFLTFRMELEPQGGSLLLILSGPEGTKEALTDFVRRLKKLA